MKFARHLAIAASLAAASGLVQAADPVANSITSGFSFEDYTGTAPVGSGKVNVNNTLFYIDEQTVGGLTSYYVFFDPSMGQVVDATITFDSAIQTVYTTKSALDGSNAMYGNPSITYTTNTYIGLEKYYDSISISGNTLTLHFDANDPGDHIRVLVSAVPEPETYALFGIGLAGLAFVVRRRRNAK